MWLWESMIREVELVADENNRQVLLKFGNHNLATEEILYNNYV